MKPFSQKNMLEYLENFNYIETKYLLCNNDSNKDLLHKLEKIESMTQESKLQKQSNSYAGQTLGRIYGFTANEKKESGELFCYTFNKIICKYLNITGLENLFNKHYYDFEWDMHLEYNTETGTYNYYRNHMEHQIRNMYMMLKILEEKNYIAEIEKLLLNSSNSQISQYVKNRIAVFTSENINKIDDRLLLDCAKAYYSNQIDNFISSDFFKNNTFKLTTYSALAFHVITYFESNCISIPKTQFLNSFKNVFNITELRNEHFFDYNSKVDVEILAECLKELFNHFECSTLTQAYLKDYSIQYVIRSAVIISALFHDLSYPLCFSLNIEKRIGEYLPSMNSFIHNLEADIDYVVSVLKPSLLFVLVDEKEIRAKLAKNQDKYDHGVLSAISLLLTFYESGRINKLPLDKQTAIELAAVAIYNHNFSYKINNEDAKDYFRPVFVQNPISFLLKVCDEMQEWERKYFELSKTDAPIFCPKCKSPIVEYKYYNNINNKKTFKETLLCRCNKNDDNEYKKSLYFPHRNIYTVTTCKTIDLVPTQNRSVVFYLDYNLVDLLHMSKIEYGYANYRAKQLNNLKMLLTNQNFCSGNSNFAIENVYLDYVMTFNPIYLKARMLLEHVATEAGDWPCDIESHKKHHYEFLRSYNVFYENKKNKLDFKDKIETCFRNLIVEPFNKRNYTSKLKRSIRDSFNNVSDQDAFYYKLILRTADEDKEALCNLADHLLTSAGINIRDKSGYIELLYSNTVEAVNDLLERKAKIYIQNIVLEMLHTDDLNLKEFFTKKLLFYVDIASFISQSLSKNIAYSEEAFLSYILKSYENKFPNSHQNHTKVIKTLLKDIFYILYNQNDVYNGRISANKYINHFNPRKEVFFAMQQYMTPANWYENNCDAYRLFSSENLDFNSDLIFFELISGKLK